VTPYTSCSGDQVQFREQYTASRSGSRFVVERVGPNGDLHATEQPGQGLPKRSTKEEADLPAGYFENTTVAQNHAI
jgi:hypothetical protein